MSGQGINHPTTNKIWRAISEAFWYDRRCPSFREIAAKVGCSVSTVERHVWKLREAGVLEYARGERRGLKLFREHPHIEAARSTGELRVREAGYWSRKIY